MSERIIARIVHPFSYVEVTVPPKYEITLGISKVKRKTKRYRDGQIVTCHGMAGFSHLRELANQYGGEVELNTEENSD